MPLIFIMQNCIQPIKISINSTSKPNVEEMSLLKLLRLSPSREAKGSISVTKQCISKIAILT